MGRRLHRRPRFGRALISVILLLAAAGSGIGLGFAAFRFAPGGQLPAPAPAPVVVSAPLSMGDAPGEAASAAPSASVGPAAVDPPVCLASMFGEGTFQKGPPELGFVCEAGALSATSRKLKETVVKSSTGSVTEGMREWAVLGYFELSATAVMQARCCPTLPDPQLPALPEECGFLPSLQALQAAAKEPVAPADQGEALVASYAKAARCVARGPSTKAFEYAAPSGGQDTNFSKTLARSWPR